MNKMERAQNGDPKALALLMRQHAPLVQALAKRFEQIQDAFQAGCVGLVKAIRGYKEEMGYAFSTYAVPLILGEMRKTREKKYGWRTEQKLRQINMIREQIIQEKGRDAAAAEIAEKTGWKMAEIAFLLEMNKQVLYYDDESRGLYEVKDPAGERWMERFFIRDILERMPEEYSYILKHRFILSESQQRLSARMHVNQSTLSRNEKKARLMFISAWQD